MLYIHLDGLFKLNCKSLCTSAKLAKISETRASAAKIVIDMGKNRAQPG